GTRLAVAQRLPDRRRAAAQDRLLGHEDEVLHAGPRLRIVDEMPLRGEGNLGEVVDAANVVGREALPGQELSVVPGKREHLVAQVAPRAMPLEFTDGLGREAVPESCQVLGVHVAFRVTLAGGETESEAEPGESRARSSGNCDSAARRPSSM